MSITLTDSDSSTGLLDSRSHISLSTYTSRSAKRRPPWLKSGKLLLEVHQFTVFRIQATGSPIAPSWSPYQPGKGKAHHWQFRTCSAIEDAECRVRRSSFREVSPRLLQMFKKIMAHSRIFILCKGFGEEDGGDNWIQDYSSPTRCQLQSNLLYLKKKTNEQKRFHSHSC